MAARYEPSSSIGVSGNFEQMSENFASCKLIEAH